MSVIYNLKESAYFKLQSDKVAYTDNRGPRNTNINKVNKVQSIRKQLQPKLQPN